MANLDAHDIGGHMRVARRQARMHRTQGMLMAAGVAALGIVAVAAAMMVPLL